MGLEVILGLSILGGKVTWPAASAGNHDHIGADQDNLRHFLGEVWFERAGLTPLRWFGVVEWHYEVKLSTSDVI